MEKEMKSEEAREILDLMINLDHKKPVPNRDLVIEAIQMANIIATRK